MNQYIRHIAYRVWISDLLTGNFVLRESELESSHILINNKKVSRVNIVATVIQKYESEDLSYVSITIDDGSADIRLKAWRDDVDLISDLMIGDLVMIIGRVKKYEDEVYLVPEIAKKVNSNWELVHKSELINEPKTVIKKDKNEAKMIETEEIRFGDNI